MHSLTRSFSVLAVVGSLLLGCSSTKTYKAIGTGSAQGADVHLEVEPVEHGNQEIRLSVTNLLPPSRIGSETAFYAVWVRHGERSQVHLANLRYNEKERVGELVTLTPYSKFELTVTAEKVALPLAPEGPVVVKQLVSVD